MCFMVLFGLEGLEEADTGRTGDTDGAQADAGIRPRVHTRTVPMAGRCVPGLVMARVVVAIVAIARVIMRVRMGTRSRGAIKVSRADSGIASTVNIRRATRQAEQQGGKSEDEGCLFHSLGCGFGW